MSEIFHIIHAQTRDISENPVEKVLSTGEIVGLANHTVLIARDGTEYHISDSGAPIRNADGKTSGVVLVFRDVTIEYAMQEQLNHSRKMDSIGQLAGGIAHDFNNMLAGIMSSSQLLKLSKNLTKEDNECVDIILQATERATDLTAKLLAFGRKGKIASTVINIHKIVDDTVAILSRTIDKKISISVEKGAQNDSIVGDISGLQNAFMNIGINASHAMPHGGKIQIKTKNIQLSKTYCDTSPFEIEPGPYIGIEIRDTGSGIPQKNLKKIFEPFYTTKEQGKGTGLGLAAVYGTIKDHHGAVNVYTEEGVGASFNILLPCSEKRVDLKQVETTVITGSGQILLVDDEEIIRILGKRILQQLGYQVLLAKNGREGLEIFQKKHAEIDLVLMDMIMPEMTGSEAFFKMKQVDNNCKVIMSSGFTRNENINEMKKSGLSGFIQKPYQYFELSQLLAKVLKTK